MCRIAAYHGPQIVLEDFLLHPPHSLMKQSWAPQEMVEATLNADGYGFAWYMPDGSCQLYTHPMPIWADANLPSLARTLKSAVWMANVRSATPGLPVNQANTQPFVDAELSFIHNGLIRDFSTSARARFHTELDVSIQVGIQGNTDSEYLFALFRQHYRNAASPSLVTALRACIRDLQDWLGNECDALLNIIVSDGQQLCTIRHAWRNKPPSLYLCQAPDEFPNAQLFASEALNDSKEWQLIRPQEIVLVDPEGEIHRMPL